MFSFLFSPWVLAPLGFICWAWLVRYSTGGKE